MTTTSRRNAHGGRLLAATILAGALAFSGLVQAQSFDSQDPSESIADSEISVAGTRAAERLEDLMASIENLPESVDRVKIITNMERIDVVYLSDMMDGGAPAELEEAVAENDERINELQNGIEGSAIFYNALNSQRVNIADVVSILLDEPNATIFVRGVAPDSGVSDETLEGSDEAPAEDDAEAPAGGEMPAASEAPAETDAPADVDEPAAQPQ
ncbi:hypothetical protein [Rhizobium sp. EC-SD404]|uniref:hypothetical protein n=1 Tax=Rhizobium sp. EC-SD404 TaxID=2038389 RepID=UPI00125ED809|nr:hypothetical protein [Rhizobium sp. EC-SD404]